MFETIKGKIQAVQQDISARFFNNGGEAFVNLNAGAELLHRYEQSWHHIHLLTNENVTRANVASVELQHLCNNVLRQADNYNQLNRELSTLPKFSDEISNLVAETAKLEGLCEEVESALSYLEVLCQTQDVEHVKLEQRFQLAMYREKKLAALNDAKTQMALDYVKRKEEKEKIRRNQNLEKQRVLQQAADKDIKIYKATGCITNSLIDDWPTSSNGVDKDPPVVVVPPDEEEDVPTTIDVSVADLLNNHMETRKAMQLTYVDDHQRHSPSFNSTYNNNSNNFSNPNNNNAGGENNPSFDLFLPEQGDRDLSALEEFLAGIKLDDSGIVGDNNED